jgi:hypothetical protein
MKQYTKYIVGAVSWSICTTIFTFSIIFYAADLANKDVIGLETYRLILLLFLSQLVSLMLLIYLNNQPNND